MPQPPHPQQTPPETPSPPPSPSRPQPTPSPSQSRSAAAGSSTASSASEFLADPGPAFDPKQAPAAPEVVDDALAQEIVEGWQEETVRNLLEQQGRVTHAIFKVGPDDTDTWKHTEDDLRSIAPPLTRMLNRYDATRAAAAAGDEIALAAALATYGAKNYTKRRRLIASIRAQEPQPITGVPADPDLGPEHDAEYARVHRLDDVPPALTPKGVR